MKKESKDQAWSDSGGSLFERFAVNLADYTRTGKIPPEGDQDIRYGLELQNERLKNKGLTMQYSFVPRGHFAGEDKALRKWKDEHYTSRLECRSCKMERNLFRGSKKEYGNQKKTMFYQTITDVNGPYLAGDDVYTCPSCGAATTFAGLQKGCPYCGACFQMSDIFPVVSNYYFLEDGSFTEEESKAYMGKFMAVTGILFFVYMLFKNYGTGGSTGQILLTSLLSGVLGGVVLGWLLSAFALLGKVIWESARTVPFVPTIGSGLRFVRLMKQYSPEFSWEYFSNKVISLLKMIIFSNELSDLPVYAGEPLGNLFEDVVDVFYTGAVGLKNFRVEEDFCFVTVNIFLDNLYDNGKRIFQKRNKYCVQVKRNIRKPVNMHFSIKHLQCKGCGASFDATKERYCPGCGKAYDLGDEDWIVTSVVKK